MATIQSNGSRPSPGRMARSGWWGQSHPGLTQTHAALYRPPHLAAIWPDVRTNNSYDHQVRRGGAMQFHMFGALFLHAQDSQEAQADPNIARAVWQGMARMRELIYATPFKPGHDPLSGVPDLRKRCSTTTRAAHTMNTGRRNSTISRRYFDRHADIPGTYTVAGIDPYVIAQANTFRNGQQNTLPSG